MVSDAEKYMKEVMAKAWERFDRAHPELVKLRGTMLEPFVDIFPSGEERKEYNRLKDKEKIKEMKKLYKVGGWASLLIGIGLIGGFGASIVFFGLTLFWIGANLPDAKCY